MSNFDTQFYHYDENAIKLLKAFVYLNDVTEEEHGPFCYVKKSHFAAEENWGKSVRYTDQQVAEMASPDDINPIFAKKGDIILANTVALHRGLKPKTQDRNILIVNYGLHQDYTFNNQLDITSRVNSSTFDSRTKEEKLAMSLLERVSL